MPKVDMQSEKNACKDKIAFETDCFEKLAACQSADELLALSDLRQIVSAAFNRKQSNEIGCPNKGCNEKFVKANTFLLHVKRCKQIAQWNSKTSEKVKKRLTGASNFNSYRDFQKRPDKWACLDSDQKLEFIKKEMAEFEGKSLVCLNKNCSKRLKVPELLLEHVNQCFLPEYFRYMDHPKEFRSLEKQTKTRILRDILKTCTSVPCINYHDLQCKYVAKNSRSLYYHLERCGVSPEERPWKCYRCGFESTSSESGAHLIECRLSETTQLLHSAEAEQSRLFNLKDSVVSNETLEESENITYKHSRKRKSSLSLPLSTNLNYVKTHRLDDSTILLPSRKAARITTSGKHQRFKFNNSNSNSNYPPPIYQKLYSEAVQKAREQFDSEELNVPLCSTLSNVTYEQWKSFSKEELTNSAKKIFDKQSIPFVILGQELKAKTSSSPSTFSEINNEHVAAKTQLSSFVFQNFLITSNNNDRASQNEGDFSAEYNGCLTYCGGPISTVSFCPRLLRNGKECVAVTVFPDEEYLISKGSDLYEPRDYLQLFFLEHSNNSVSANLGCIVEIEVGTILASVWCPVLRDGLKCDSLNSCIGLLAAAGTRGNIGIYMLDANFLAELEQVEGTKFFHAKPAFELMLKDEPSVPTIALSWSTFGGGAKIASVAASGFVYIWDLSNSDDVPLSISPISGAMSPYAVSFVSMHDVAITYREKILRVYNIEKKEMVVEENSSRTAGHKVYTCPRIFSGIFCYQGDNITTANSVFSPCCYITLGDIDKKIFVVPMPNRHEVVMWDLSICPYSGSLLTVGGDGNLNLSLTGRLLPHFAEKELSFCASRTLMNLRRKTAKNNDEDDYKCNIEEKEMEKVEALRFPDVDDSDENKDDKAPRKPATDLETGIEQFYLEISFNETQVYRELLTYSLDIRFESLNRLAVSEAKGNIAVCGGEAGLLFFLPF